MKILLPGIAGFVGKSVARHLLEAGHEIVGMIRSEKDRAQVEASDRIQLVIGDVTKPDGLRASLGSIDGCIYLPGLLREFPDKGIKFKSVHADGVRNLIEVCKAKGATRWVQMSALGVGRGYHTGYYETKLEGEAHVKASGLEWTIFRPSVIYSEEYDKRLNFVSELGNVIEKAPIIPMFGDGMYRLQPVALDVLAKAMVDSLTMSDTHNKTYEVGGNEKLSYKSILKTIATAQGLGSKPIVSIPFGPMRFAASLLDKYSFFPFSQDQLTMLEHENIVNDPMTEREFEVVFEPRRVKFEDGVRSFFAGKKKR